MGKVTGFMEFERLSEHYEEPKKRVKHYKEFVMTLSDDEAKTQGARCMAAGWPSPAIDSGSESRQAVAAET